MKDKIKGYFLDQDNDCHWFIIPVDKKDEWKKWLDLDSDNEEAWVEPPFAIVLNGSPSRVVFQNYEVSK